MSRCFFAVALLCTIAGVRGVNMYGEGSPLHHEETAGALPREQKEPVFHHVTRLRNERAFYTEVARSALVLVFFYTKWSHASMAMVAELDLQAEALLSDHPGIPVYAVDLQEVPALGREYRVNNIPSFGVFRLGSLAQRSEQTVPKYAPAIAGYMRTLLYPAVTMLTTLNSAAKIVDPDSKIPGGKAKPGLVPVAVRHPDDDIAKTIVICFTEEEEFIANIHDVSRLVAGFFTMYHVDNKKIRAAYGAEDNTCVVYRRWADFTPIVHRLESTENLNMKLMQWMIYNAIPPMAMFDEESKPLYVQRMKPLLVYFSPSRLPESDPLFRVLAAIGTDEALNVTATQCDPNSSGKYIAHFLGMDGALRHGGWAIGMMIARRKFRFDISKPPTDENIREFVRAVVNGTWPEFFKSEPQSVIHPHGSGRVNQIAYVDFERAVLGDKDKDLLLLMYRHDDNHSMDVLRMFDTVADRMKSLDIIVARQDVFENDYHPAYNVPGTPSILYAKRTDKMRPVRMVGAARTLENIETFVVQQASVSLSAASPSNQTPSASPPPAPLNSNRGTDEL